MNTTTPNSPFGQSGQARNTGSNTRKSNDGIGRQAAAAGIGAVGGGVAGWAAGANSNSEEEVIVENVEEQQEQQTTAATSQPAKPQQQTQSSNVDGNSAAHIINDGQNNNGGDSHNNDNNNDNNNNNENGNGNGDDPHNGSHTGPGPDDEPAFDPNDIEINAEEIDLSVGDETDAILADEFIDPNDINMGDKVVFDNVGTVYTLDGEAYSAATFHFEGDEDQFVMVDIDGDEVFDIITDDNFTVEVETPYDFSYGDAEQQLSAENPEYMAAADADVELPDGVDFNDDIILT